MGTALDRRPRVAVYTPTYLPTSETFIYRQLMSYESVEPIVLTRSIRNLDRFPFDPKKRISPRLSRRLFEHVERTCWRMPTEPPTPSQTRYLLQILQSRKVDLVHAHFGDRALRIAPACALLGVPLVVTFHGYDASRLLLDERFAPLYADLFNTASLIIGVSERIRERLVEYGSDPLHTARHYIGVPLPPDSALSRFEFPSVVQVARFTPKKGHEVTVRAFALAVARNPSLRLTLIGDGPLRPKISALVNQLGLESYVRFTGDLPSEQVASHLRGARVFVHPSQTEPGGDEEGLPTAVLEAMSHGLPIISTRHAGIPEAVTPSCGVLCEEGDFEGISRAIEMLGTTREDAARFGAHARNTVERRFNIVTNTAKLEFAYSKVIDGRSDLAAASLTELQHSE